MKKVRFHDWGLRDYKQAWEDQEKIFQNIVDSKFAARRLKDGGQIPTTDHLIFCEHPPVYTLGKSGDISHLLLSKDALNEKGAGFYKINRGGDITYHGPGQLIGYPILNLDHFFPDVHKYLRYLEEIFIRILADYGLRGERSEGETGVWLEVRTANPRKILALGVRASRWVTMHGWAFNVNTDLRYFDYIVPCGIKDKSVTSLQKELGREVPMQEIIEKARYYFQEIFEVQLED